MADLDYGRKMDLEELAKAMENARSQSEREHYERIAHKIINESTEIKYLRHHLIGAMRENDVRGIRVITGRIQEQRMRETNGTSWGNNRNERKLLN
jgi:hypothetical protein